MPIPCDIGDVARRHMFAILAPILADEALDDLRWTSLSVVFLVGPEGRSVSNYGYVYSKRDWWAVAFPVARTRDPILDYLGPVFPSCGESSSVASPSRRQAGGARLELRDADERAGSFDANSGEPSYENAFTALPARLPATPHRGTHRPRIDGSQIAIVAGPEGEERRASQSARRRA